MGFGDWASREIRETRLIGNLRENRAARYECFSLGRVKRRVKFWARQRRLSSNACKKNFNKPLSPFSLLRGHFLSGAWECGGPNGNARVLTSDVTKLEWGLEG